MSEIKSRIKSGVVYTATAKYIGILFSIIIGAILARLLTPKEFGVVALVVVFTSFFNILGNAGIGSAVIQNKSLKREDLKSIFSFTIILSIFFSFIFYSLANKISNFYNVTEIIIIIKLLSVSVFFNLLRIVPEAICLKREQFKVKGIIVVTIQLLTGILAIILAYKGYSYYSLVYKSILDSILIYVCLFFLNPVLPTIKIRLDSLRVIARYSSFQFLFNLINYFSRNADNILIGKFLGPVQLGFYDKAYQLMMLPAGNLTGVITPVLHPVLSKYQDNKEQIYNSYVKLLMILAYVGFPLSIFLFFSSEETVYLLYGNQWSESTRVFKILSLTVGLQIVVSSTGSIFQSLNKTDLLFLTGFVSFILIVGSILIGVFFYGSIESIGFLLLTTFILNFIFVFIIMTRLIFKVSFKKFIKVFVYPIFVSFIVGFFLWLFSFIAIESKMLRFLMNVFIFLFIWIYFFFQKKEYKELFYTLINRS